MANQTPAMGRKIKKCLDRETTDERLECAMTELANHADHVDKTMENMGKELGSLQDSVALLPRTDDLVDLERRMNDKITLLPSKGDLAAESTRVIDAFNKKLGIEIKAVVKAVDGTRDALARAVDESITRVNARLDTMATKDDLKAFATKDDLDVAVGKIVAKLDEE